MHTLSLHDALPISKRTFDRVDRYKFRESGFSEIQTFFERSSEEIRQAEGIDSRFRRLDAYGFSCTVINESFGRGVAHLTVRMGADDRGGMGDVYWSYQENAKDNTANGWASVAHSEYELFFELHDFGVGGPEPEDNHFKPSQLATYLWDRLLERAGITYD